MFMGRDRLILVEVDANQLSEAVADEVQAPDRPDGRRT